MLREKTGDRTPKQSHAVNQAAALPGSDTSETASSAVAAECSLVSDTSGRRYNTAEHCIKRAELRLFETRLHPSGRPSYTAHYSPDTTRKDTMITAQLVDEHLARAANAHRWPTASIASGSLQASDGDRRSPDLHQPLPKKDAPPSSSSTCRTASLNSFDKEEYVTYLESLKEQLEKYAERR